MREDKREYAAKAIPSEDNKVKWRNEISQPYGVYNSCGCVLVCARDR